jgi:hypothetical protein
VLTDQARARRGHPQATPATLWHRRPPTAICSVPYQEPMDLSLLRDLLVFRTLIAPHVFLVAYFQRRDALLHLAYV